MGLTYAQAVTIGIGHLHPDHAGNPTPRAPEAVPPPPRSKYRNRPTTYNGVRYHSKAEAVRAEVLDDMKARGLVAWWLGQYRFRLGCPENVYVADFIVGEVNPEGGVFVHAEDVKGAETAKFRHDVKLWRSYGPFALWVLKRGRLVEVIVPKRLGGGDEPC